ncbi:MAG: hypothetical protein JRE47_13175 [Deltaproteobacteria bacterium]|nr:hypothetical protein [Deltaproteobacteria bacterium]
MSKVIKVSVKRWAGSVTFCDPLTAPQVFAIEDALDETAKTDPSSFLAMNAKEGVELSWPSRRTYAYLPAIIACIDDYDLKDFPDNVTKDTWPLSPRDDASILVSKLFSELIMIYRGEVEEVPNE